MTVVSEQQLPVDDTLTTMGGDTARRVLTTLNGKSHDVTILPDEVDMDTYANASRRYQGLAVDVNTYIMKVPEKCQDALRQMYQTRWGCRGGQQFMWGNKVVPVWFSLKKSESGNDSYVQMMFTNNESLDDTWKALIFPKKGGWRITMTSWSLRELIFGRGAMALSPLRSRPTTPYKPTFPEGVKCVEFRAPIQVRIMENDGIQYGTVDTIDTLQSGMSTMKEPLNVTVPEMYSNYLRQVYEARAASGFGVTFVLESVTDQSMLLSVLQGNTYSKGGRVLRMVLEMEDIVSDTSWKAQMFWNDGWKLAVDNVLRQKIQEMSIPIAETVDFETTGSQNENIDPTQEKRNPNTPFGNDVAASLGFIEREIPESPRQLKETLDMARAYTEENDIVDGNPPIRQEGQDIGVVVGTPVCVQGIPIDMYGVIPQTFHVPMGGYPMGSVMQAPPLHVPMNAHIFDPDGPEMQVLDDLASIQNVPDGPASPGCQHFLEGLMFQSEESQRSNKRLRRDTSTMEALEVDVYGVNTKRKIDVIKSVCITPLSEEVKTKFIQEILDVAAAAVLRDNIYVSVWVRDVDNHKISTCHVSSKEGGANFTLKSEVHAREHGTWKERGGKKMPVFYFPLVLKQYRIIVCAVCTGDEMNENPFLSLCTDGCLLQENVDICQKPYRKDQIKVPYPYFANVTLGETRMNFLFQRPIETLG